MSEVTDDYAALMLDYSAGALAPAFRLLVDVHLDMREEGRVFTNHADAIGGAFLERITPAPMSSTPLPVGAGEKPAEAETFDAVRSRITMAAEGPDGLAWRWRLPGLREHRLPLSGASLLRIPAGRAMPRHGHDGQELTLILSGAFEDERGHYSAGEIVFADAAIEHRPRVTGDGECVCLVVESGRPRLRTWWGRAIGRAVH